MKANELMIGDWVRDNLTQMPLQVNASCIRQFERQEEQGEDMSALPIPLTEEILKANGFITDNNHTLTGSCIYHRLCGKYEEYKITIRLLNGWIKIESFDDRWYTLLDLSIQPRYVHELQHCLRLCGINDLADNLKIK